MFDHILDADDWTSALGVQVPVMLKVTGKTYKYNPQGREINHVYKFTQFRDFITDDDQDKFMVRAASRCGITAKIIIVIKYY